MLIVPLGGPVVAPWRCPFSCPFPSVRVSCSVPSVAASLGSRSWPAYVVSSAIRSDLSDSSRSAQSRWSTGHDSRLRRFEFHLPSLVHFWWNHSTVITNANSFKNVVIGQRNSLEHLDIVSFHSTLHADSFLPCDGLSLFLAQRRSMLVEHRNTRPTHLRDIVVLIRSAHCALDLCLSNGRMLWKGDDDERAGSRATCKVYQRLRSETRQPFSLQAIEAKLRLTTARRFLHVPNCFTLLNAGECNASVSLVTLIAPINGSGRGLLAGWFRNRNLPTK